MFFFVLILYVIYFYTLHISIYISNAQSNLLSPLCMLCLCNNKNIWHVVMSIMKLLKIPVIQYNFISVMLEVPLLICPKGFVDVQWCQRVIYKPILYLYIWSAPCCIILIVIFLAWIILLHNDLFRYSALACTVHFVGSSRCVTQ